MNFSNIFQPLVAAYPNHPFQAATAKLYASMLSDLEERELKRAVLEHIAESNFFPTVAELRRRAQKQGVSAEREWLEIMRAFREQGKCDISPVARAALDGIGGMSSLLHNGVSAADRAHFFRLYEALREEEEGNRRRQVIEAIMDERKAIE